MSYFLRELCHQLLSLDVVHVIFKICEGIITKVKLLILLVSMVLQMGSVGVVLSIYSFLVILWIRPSPKFLRDLIGVHFHHYPFRSQWKRESPSFKINLFLMLCNHLSLKITSTVDNGRINKFLFTIMEGNSMVIPWYILDAETFSPIFI